MKDIIIQPALVPQKRKRLSESRKQLRKLVRQYARDKLFNEEVREGEQAAMYAGFTHCMNLIMQASQLSKDKTADESITFKTLLDEIKNLWENTSYTRTLIEHFHNKAYDKDLL